MVVHIPKPILSYIENNNSTTFYDPISKKRIKIRDYGNPSIIETDILEEGNALEKVYSEKGTPTKISTHTFIDLFYKNEELKEIKKSIENNVKEIRETI